MAPFGPNGVLTEMTVGSKLVFVGGGGMGSSNSNRMTWRTRSARRVEHILRRRPGSQHIVRTDSASPTISEAYVAAYPHRQALPRLSAGTPGDDGGQRTTWSRTAKVEIEVTAVVPVPISAVPFTRHAASRAAALPNRSCSTPNLPRSKPHAQRDVGHAGGRSPATSARWLNRRSDRGASMGVAPAVFLNRRVSGDAGAGVAGDALVSVSGADRRAHRIPPTSGGAADLGACPACAYQLLGWLYGRCSTSVSSRCPTRGGRSPRVVQRALGTPRWRPCCATPRPPGLSSRRRG